MTEFINLNNLLSQVTISDCNIPWLDDSEVLISCTTLQQDNEQSTENILLAAF